MERLRDDLRFAVRSLRRSLRVSTSASCHPHRSHRRAASGLTCGGASHRCAVGQRGTIWVMTETVTLSARRGRTLFREVPNAERNRQADHDHVDYQALNQVV